MTSSTKYTLIFKNNSEDFTGSACVYQEPPDLSDPRIMSLAWFCHPTAPTTEVVFDWTIDYSFVWSQTGELRPGIRFAASQNWPANLSSQNSVTFTKEGGIYTFKDQEQFGQEGTLYIKQDPTVPNHEASVGIGMSGAGVFVEQARPNITHTFSPKPKYWITFGRMVQGEVLDIGTITEKAEVNFPHGVFSMTAILNPDNSWTVQRTDQVNASFLEAQKKNSGARWGDLAA